MKDYKSHNSGFIGVDFDGTLATTVKDFSEEATGEPIQPMVDKVKKWIKEGKDVRLFTARKPHPALRRWMTKNLGVILPIENVKQPTMYAFYDDRAIAVERDTGELYSEENEDSVLDE